jgi:hypothetical protein
MFSIERGYQTLRKIRAPPRCAAPRRRIESQGSLHGMDGARLALQGLLQHQASHHICTQPKYV